MQLKCRLAYKNPDQVETLGRRSRQYAVEHYALEQALNHYEALFHSVTACPVKETHALPKYEM